MTPLRVGVDARLDSGMSGGVEQVVIGLAAALSRLDDGDEEYLFLTHPEHEEWIRPYLAGPCRAVQGDLEFPGETGLVPALRRVGRRRPLFLGGSPGGVPRSDGTLERAGAEVVHFTIQEAFLTDLPSIYQPHDLQHLHLPEAFSRRERSRRERVYRTHCERAAMVVAMTSWGKDDLIRHYGLPAEKVGVVSWGSVLSDYPAPSPQDLDRLRSRLALPEAFLLYPAQTWPHKNHERLLDALAVIRDKEGLTIPLVCPGQQNRYFGRIRKRARELDLEQTTWFPGFVSPLELRGLYRLARALVFPSRFEGWGLPVCEAFSSGLPVASSSAASLPELVGDAGLIFDPDDTDEIASSVLRLWTDSELRASLAERGLRRAERFTFDHAVRVFRAHYRRIAGRRLAEEDRILLESPPLA